MSLIPGGDQPIQVVRVKEKGLERKYKHPCKKALGKVAKALQKNPATAP